MSVTKISIRQLFLATNGMKHIPITWIVAFAAGMFFTNQAGASVYGCDSAADVQAHITALPSDADEGAQSARLSHVDQICMLQCARSSESQSNPLAAPSSDTIPVPIRAESFLFVRLESARARVALAPPAAGPPLTLLFHNLRN